jgi:hypothetical protein
MIHELIYPSTFKKLLALDMVNLIQETYGWPNVLQVQNYIFAPDKQNKIIFAPRIRPVFFYETETPQTVIC